jgi:hypothetical protein
MEPWKQYREFAEECREVNTSGEDLNQISTGRPLPSRKAISS